MVYVTHDQTEAMTLGDRVAVMRAGIIQQVDTPANLYEDPVNLFVAGFIGSPSMNFLPGAARGRHDQAAVRRRADPRRAARKLQAAPGGHKAGMDVIAGIRPEHFEDAAVEDRAAPTACKFKAKVDVVESMGSELYVYFDVQARGHRVRPSSPSWPRTPAWRTCRRTAAASRSSPASTRASRARPAARSSSVLDTSQIKLFDPDGGRSLTASTTRPLPARRPRAALVRARRRRAARLASGVGSPRAPARAVVEAVHAVDVRGLVADARAAVSVGDRAARARRCRSRTSTFTLALGGGGLAAISDSTSCSSVTSSGGSTVSDRAAGSAWGPARR